MELIDWQINKTHLQCTKHILTHNINCDVNFKVGADCEIIKAHRFILSMRSPVFEKMFNGTFIESRQDPKVPDIDPEAFKALLRYCYYDCLEIYIEDAVYILQAATKYMLPELAGTARQMLINNLTVTNIWQVYIYSVQVEDRQLLEACRRYFQKTVGAARRALYSNYFLDVTYEVIVDLLRIKNQEDQHDEETDGTEKEVSGNEEDEDNSEYMSDHRSASESSSDNDSVVNVVAKNNDYIEVESENEEDEDLEQPTEMDGMGVCIAEVELFKACDAWAEAECFRRRIDTSGKNKRLVLGGALFLLRLPTMKHKDLVNIVYPSDILSQAEKDGLSVYKHNENASEYSLEFPLTPRNFLLLAGPKLQNRHHSLTQTGHYSRGANRVLSSLCIESTVTAELSKIWLPGSDYRVEGTANVTITNDDSGERWSKPVQIQRQNQLVAQSDLPPLFYLPIKAFALMPDVRYSIDVAHACNLEEGSRVRYEVRDLSIGKPRILDEVQVYGIKKGNQCVYALTVCLI